MRHLQESELEFRLESEEGINYPCMRGIIVWQYGGTLEECIASARNAFKLDYKWKLVRSEAPNI
jgi:hypothetical protein